MPINVEKVAVDAVWAALEGRSGFIDLVGEGGRIKTSEDFWTDKDQPNANGGMYPRVRVLVTSNNTTKPATVLDFDGVDYPIEGRMEIEIRTMFEFAKDDKVMPLEAEIDAAILGSGIDLGIPFVRWATTRKTRKVESTKETGGMLRTVSRQTLTLETSVMSSEFA